MFKIYENVFVFWGLYLPYLPFFYPEGNLNFVKSEFNTIDRRREGGISFVEVGINL